MSRSVKALLLFDTHNGSGDAWGTEAKLDAMALGSRYTDVEAPVEDEDKIDQAAGILAELTPAQRQAAELHGMASMSFAEAARFVGNDPGCVSMAWYRVVEKATGETPPRLEKRRAWERERMKVKTPRSAQTSPVHGKNSTYVNYRCKCEPCLAAHREAQRKWREKKKSKKSG